MDRRQRERGILLSHGGGFHAAVFEKARGVLQRQKQLPVGLRKFLIGKQKQVALALRPGIQHAAEAERPAECRRSRLVSGEQRLDLFLLRAERGGDPVIDPVLGVQMRLLLPELVFHGDQLVFLAQQLVGFIKTAALAVERGLVLGPENVARAERHAAQACVRLQVERR